MPRILLIGLLVVFVGTMHLQSRGAVCHSAVRPEVLTRLAAQAARDGQVRIIVGLILPPPGFRAEGHLTSSEIQKQRDAIRSARNALLESLAGHTIEVYATYDSLPFAALKADADALHTLANSPYVKSIQEDSALQSHSTDSASEEKGDASPAEEPAEAD